MDKVNVDAWINRSATDTGGISDLAARQAHAVLCAGPAAPAEGDALPPLWHWFAFPPTTPQHELGADGHPRLGSFMPPLQRKRRMWAGGALSFHAPLHIGEKITRQTTIADIAEKTGASGKIVVVRLDHEIHGEDGLAVQERQDLVYLDFPDRYRAPKAIPAPEQADICEDVSISNTLLFRYSAITFNAHRIHYDLPYAQKIEHYPDLVVHGPLQANLLMDQAIRHRGLPPQTFTYRGVHPLFAQDALSVQAVKTSASEWSLCTVAGGEHQCMQARASWES